MPNETPERRNARRVAFLAGMKVGTVTLVPGGVSQAAACDGNSFSVTLARNDVKALPGTFLPSRIRGRWNRPVRNSLSENLQSC